MAQAMNVFDLMGTIDFDATGFMSKMDQVKSKVTETQDGMSKFKDIGKDMQKKGAVMTAAVSVPLGIMAKKAVDAGSSFEQGMNRVEAISGATAEGLEKLKNQAKELGKESVFSASEATGAMEMMASAGFKTEEIYDSMNGVMDLAAVSGGNMALASEAVAAAVNQFKLEAEDATHVADVFAKASSETNAQTDDMAEAMKNAGPMASSLGVSIEETSAMIGLMANQNIKGGLAGTTLKNSLLQLTGASDEAKGMLNSMGVEVFDSSGEMNSMQTIISQLREGMSGMTDEQKQNTVATIFGRQAIGGMMALINSAPGELEEMTEGLVNSDGAASDMAETMNQGLPGALASMKSSIEGAMIALSEALAPIIEVGAKIITVLADAFSAMPNWVQTAVAGVMAILIVVGPLVTMIGTMIVAFTTLGPVVAAAAAAAAPYIAAIGLAITAITLLSKGIKAVIGWVKDLGITWEDIGDLMVDSAKFVFDMITAPARATYEVFRTVINKILGLFGFEFEFPSLMDAAERAWAGVKDFFSGAMDGVKSIFSFEWLTGGFNNKNNRRNVTPRHEVTQNAKGGVFRESTIFNTANAGLQEVGEAGAEAIIPLDSNVLAGIGRGIDSQRDTNSNQGNGRLEELVIELTKEVIGLKNNNKDLAVEMDGRVVGKLVAPHVDDNLGKRRHLNNNRF